LENFDLDIVKLQKRFRDDCLNIVESCNATQAINAIIKLGSMYPGHLGNNATLLHLNIHHLDCCALKKIGSCKTVRFIRRNLEFPVSVISPDSNCSMVTKYAVVSSELVRHRKICKNKKFIRINDKLLYDELLSAGHSSKDLVKIFDKVVKRIHDRYDQNSWKKLNIVLDEELCTYVVHSLVYDRQNDDELLLRGLLCPKGSGNSHTVVYKNGRKVLHFLISRKRDLQKMQDFTKK
jgi:hypothetical protein